MTRMLPSDARLRQGLAAVGAAGLTAVLVYLVFPALGGIAGMPTAVVFQGAVVGLVSGLTATGLVLIYRSLRVINFAQVSLGAPGAVLSFELIRYVPRVPFALAVALGIGLGVGTGVLVDLVFGRRFANAPRLMLTVATIIATFVLALELTAAVHNLPFFPPRALRPLSDFSQPNALRPYLPFRGLSFGIGSSSLRFGFAEVFAIELALAAFVALAAFLRLAKAGVALRAVAENSERAALLGVGVGAMGTLVWAIAGALAGIGAILTGMLSAPATAYSFNFSSLIVPMVAAVIARFRSIPVAVFVTVLLSTITNGWQYAVVRDSPLISAGLLIAAVVALAVQRRGLFRQEVAATASWEASEEVRPVPKQFEGVVGIAAAKWTAIAVVVAGLVLLPFATSTSIVVLAQAIALMGIVAVSLVVLTGWAGQVSLGQYGFVALGAVLGGGLTSRAGVPFWVAVPLTVALCAAFSLVVGLPALRVQGLFLGVVTFMFSVAATDVLFDKRYFGWLLPTGAVTRPTAFVLNFNDERSMYFLCLGCFMLSVVVVVNLRRSRLGRLLIAVRENESNVQSFGISVVRTKLLAFAIAGGLCGFAGILFAHQLRAVTPATFGVDRSVIVFVYAVLGGVSSIVGVLLGVAYYEITGYAFGHNLVLTFIAGNLPLILLFVAPAGLISVLAGLRDGVLRIVAQRRGMVVPSLFADYDPEALAHKLIPLAEPITGLGLSASGQLRRFRLPSRLYAGPGSVTASRSAPDAAPQGVLR